MTVVTLATRPRIDARTLVPSETDRLLFATFQGLRPGQAMELISDHEPIAQRDEFSAEMPPELFSWGYLEEGPDTWRVSITRLAPKSGGCGSCNGCET